jgi:hypothetical protein
MTGVVLDGCPARAWTVRFDWRSPNAVLSTAMTVPLGLL